MRGHIHNTYTNLREIGRRGEYIYEGGRSDGCLKIIILEYAPNGWSGTNSGFVQRYIGKSRMI